MSCAFDSRAYVAVNVPVRVWPCLALPVFLGTLAEMMVGGPTSILPPFQSGLRHTTRFAPSWQADSLSPSAGTFSHSQDPGKGSYAVPPDGVRGLRSRIGPGVPDCAPRQPMEGGERLERSGSSSKVPGLVRAIHPHE